MKYAAKTQVDSEKSQVEIRRTLARYGASKFGYMEEEGRAIIAFQVNNRRMRFILPLPSRTDEAIVKTAHKDAWNRKTRSVTAQHEAYEQAIRQRWRALTLAIKAKLEIVESGIASFEEEFMAYMILPSGQTVGEWLAPQIEDVYSSGKMPPFLLTSGQD